MTNFCAQLSRLNHNKNFFWSDEENCIITECDISSVICPKGFYVRNIESNYAEITNKHNTLEKSYEIYLLRQLH